MKFVIQNHTTGNEHYDLMIEISDTLLTWQIPFMDFKYFLDSSEISAPRIQDHRKKYLSYEGPISCDRGRVDIFDSGDYNGRINSPDSFSIKIKGHKLKGTLSIIKKQNTLFLLKYTPDDPK